jgi:hypothetical protein
MKFLLRHRTILLIGTLAVGVLLFSYALRFIHSMTEPEDTTATTEIEPDSVVERDQSRVSKVENQRTATWDLPGRGDERDSSERPYNWASTIVEDLHQAIRLEDPELALVSLEKLQACRRAPASPQELASRIDAWKNSLQGNQIEGLTRAMVDRKIALMNQRFQECMYTREESDRVLDESIREQAERGNPFARFIYSMWAFNDADSLAMGSNVLANFEARALDFTLANINDGHYLGLLAMGLSYFNGTNFTTKRWSLAAAYLMASTLCGTDSRLVDQPLAVIHQFQTTLVTQLAQEEVSTKMENLAALEIYDESCGVGHD